MLAAVVLSQLEWRPMVEGAAVAAGALVTVLTLLTMLWNRWPIRWIREQRDADQAHKLTAAIETAGEPWREEIRELIACVTLAVTQIQADIAPTNGDRRSISDRVDAAKQAAAAVKDELDTYRDAQRVERTARQEVVDEQIEDLQHTVRAGTTEIKGGIAAIAESRPEEPRAHEVHVVVEQSTPEQ